MQVTSFDRNLEKSNEHPAGFPTGYIRKSNHETPGADSTASSKHYGYLLYGCYID